MQGRGVGGIGLAQTNRLHHRAVAAEAVTQLRGIVIGSRHQQADRRLEHMAKLRPDDVVGRGEDGVVEGDIGAVELLHGAAAMHRCGHAVVGLLDGGQVLGGGLGGRQGGDEGFDGDAESVDVPCQLRMRHRVARHPAGDARIEQMPLAERIDAGALAGGAGENPGIDQALDRGAHGGAALGVLIAQVQLTRNQAARRVAILEDGLRQPFGDIDTRGRGVAG